MFEKIGFKDFKHKKIVLFGIGGAGHCTMNNLIKHDLAENLVAIIDNDKGKHGSIFMDVCKVSPPNNLKTIYDHETVIIIATMFYHSVIKQIRMLLPEVEYNSIYVDFHNENPYPDVDCADYNETTFEDIQNILEDSYSRFLFDSIMFLRKNMGLLRADDAEKIEPWKGYWGDFQLDWGQDITVIDCGAYIGDNIIPISNTLGNAVKRYYALEPNDESFQKLVEYAKHVNMELFPIHKGAWSETTTLFFSKQKERNLEVYSAFSDPSDEADSVEVMALDELNLEACEDIYIKMDIEGSEISALHGAEQLIKTKRPKLAICAYHRSRDLINIPMLILSMNPEYQIYLRGGMHYVLYAL